MRHVYTLRYTTRQVMRQIDSFCVVRIQLGGQVIRCFLVVRGFPGHSESPYG